MKASQRKPPELRGRGAIFGGQCHTDVEGERVVQLTAYLFDRRKSAKELQRLGEWLLRASKWLEEGRSQ
jgi:hypothetical protein